MRFACLRLLLLREAVSLIVVARVEDTNRPMRPVRVRSFVKPRVPATSHVFLANR